MIDPRVEAGTLEAEVVVRMGGDRAGACGIGATVSAPHPQSVTLNPPSPYTLPVHLGLIASAVLPICHTDYIPG